MELLAGIIQKLVEIAEEDRIEISRIGRASRNGTVSGETQLARWDASETLKMHSAERH
jgi:hypothetical protein